MDWLHAFWLSVLQGITEFLPISSSGHLALIPSLFGWPDQGLAFDITVHVGTLIAVLVYFHRDIRLILGDWIRSIFGGDQTIYSKLAWSIAFATVLVGIAGVILESWVSTKFRHPVAIALTTMLFAVFMAMADRWSRKERDITSIGWKDVLVIGAAQVLALMPGTSRSGVTMSAGLMMGLSRSAAARFSFLMAIPVIALAGIWKGRGLVLQDSVVNWPVLLFSTLVSAVIALICIHYFLRYLQKFSLMPFVYYRLILGVILLWVFM